MDFLFHAIAFFIPFLVFVPAAVRDSPGKVICLIAIAIIAITVAARIGPVTSEIIFSLVIVPVLLSIAVTYWLGASPMTAVKFCATFIVVSISLAVIMARYYRDA